ncbi:hypothetical protein [Leeuwenhoekiella sp. W20_SRS_FM14]|uniref:hypothetical protein n=1 Tax=Leeuwenhoekiella sp. W20_SRS_FM14 TaxID=3240270 RepID=UPI003F9AACE7
MMKIERTTKYVLSSELIFTLLPIIILLIVRSYENDFSKVFYNTEWSIISIILFGQSIVKFSSGIANSNETFRWQLVALVISLIIVFGLIPASIILVLNLTSSSIGLGMGVLQIIVFIISVLTYYFIGAIGQKMLEEK